MKEKNIRLVLQYDGSRYDGWQKQGNTDKTIQGRLEQVLEKMAGQPVEVFGSGRTDAGVHALKQTANFHLTGQAAAMKAGEISTYLNRYLPEDIAVTAVSEAPLRFHSRLNAVKKQYLYRIETAEKKDVFERKYLYGLGRTLDVAAMERAAEVLSGTHDFRAFCSLKRVKKSNVRTLEPITITKKGTRVELSFIGNGFLYNMVRILAGTLIEVGTHQRTEESVLAALESGEREQAGYTAPPEGLFLAEVWYPENISK